MLNAQTISMVLSLRGLISNKMVSFGNDWDLPIKQIKLIIYRGGLFKGRFLC